MAVQKASFLALLLLFGTFLLVSNARHANAKDCTRECDTRIAYGICPLASGNKRISFDPICTNCCAGKKGCNYFSADGTFICEGESEYESNKVENSVGKACTLECDPRIAYGICPLTSGNKRISSNRICTNCCAGKKGCNYFSADGTFICEGESEYVSNKVENSVGKACTLECDPRIAYGICPLASENKRISSNRICTNCCAGKKGCNYFSADGTFICEGESEYVSNKVENSVGKACTLECDPRIAYGICPLASGNKRISSNRICTNCCAGKKGCNYFSANGTFICEGESEYVSNKVENSVGKACTKECDIRIAYGICPLASGNKGINFDRICTNCCAGKKGCNYFSADGTFICEGESEYVSNKVEKKACTLECDLRIAYGICPRASGNKRISSDRICTNCCAGQKGCNYFSADGTFICEGESEYVSNEENDLAVA